MNKISILDTYNFLKDFEDKNKTYVLSESKDSKERKELIEVAKAKGIIVEGSPDIAVFKTVYTFADKANGNKDYLPEKELLKALPTLIGKSVNIDHIRTYVVGHYIDYRYIEKEKKVIAYGIFFKHAFDKEWDEAKKLMKEGKLASSHEILHDLDKEEIVGDIHILHDLQISGGALIMREKPAFKETKALALSSEEKTFLNRVKENIDKISKEPKKYSLVYACLTEDGKKGLCSNKQKTLTVASLAEQIQQPEVKVEPTIPKKNIICQNCGKNFEYIFSSNDAGIGISEIQCPNCWCILDEVGKVIYPSQNRNFDLACSKCQSRNNWLIMEDNGDLAKVKCKSCQEEYEISFADIGIKQKLTKQIRWLKHISFPCLQCGHRIEYAGVSTAKKADLKCNDCGLKFSVDFSEIKSKRTINNIEPIKVVKEEIKKDELLSKKIEEETEMEKTEVRKLLKKAVAKIRGLRKESSLSKSSLDEKNTKVDKFAGGIKRLSDKIHGLRKVGKDYELKLAALIEEKEETKKFYMSKASELHERKTELKGFEHGYSDEELMDNLKFELAISKMKISKQEKELQEKEQKQPKLNTASQNVGDKTKNEDKEWFAEQKKGVDGYAFNEE